MGDSKDTVTLIVNGQQKEVSLKELSPNAEISFDEIVRLAFADPPSGEYIVFTVSYWNGAGWPAEGILYSGEIVKVKEGTVFNVTVTDKS